MERYNPQEIEKKWQKRWLEEKVFKVSDDSPKPKYYQLETFPYPSGAGLHVGHPKGYIAEDIHARFMRMNGREVLYTMGWDAFGLPTENYAIKVGKTPQQVTIENTDNFRRQVRMFGFSYDWDREINTSTPEYYKWTQWLFIQLFKKGLAYRAKAKVNWCPKDQTVIANEQVINGTCERCGSVIEERFMEQWMLRITDYADRLLSGLDGLDWPSATVKRQEDWIGKSEGAELTFAVTHGANNVETTGISGKITVFTTRPDTLFGVTYVVLAPEHSLVKILQPSITNWDEVAAYIEHTSHKTDLMRQESAKEKTGVELKGIKAINPINQEEIPVWVADYVLGSYGTGAIMAVPAHDERDFAFAQKFNLPTRVVIEPETGPKAENEQFRRSIVAVVEDPKTGKFLTLNWGPKFGGQLFIGGGMEEGEDAAATAMREIGEETGYTNMELVSQSENMHHHYFAFSKNVARCTEVTGLYFRLTDDARTTNDLKDDEVGKFAVEWITKDEVLSHVEDENHILVFKRLVMKEIYAGYGRLTASEKFNGMDSEKAKWEITTAAGGTRKTQYKLRDWSVSRQRYWGVPIPMIYCDTCGIVPVPDAELPVILPLMENYRPQGSAPLASDPAFINVKCPQCGGDAKRDAETFDTFVDSSWYYLRYTDPHNVSAIFDKEKAKHWLPVDLYVIGAEHTVLHLLYSRFITKFLHDEGYVNFEEPFLKLRHQGLIRGNDGQKMSKSKGNVVNPDELVGEFGADTVRLYEMFMGPFEDGAPWDPKGILGVNRFLGRFWKYVNMVCEVQEKSSWQIATQGDKRSSVQRTIKKVGEDIQNFKFNTSISALMVLINELAVGEKGGTFAVLDQKDLHALIQLIHPLAPHMGQELWELAKCDGYVDFSTWPVYDPALIAQESITLVLQINGKVKDTVSVTPAITEDEAKSMALENAKIKASLGAETPRRVIYIDKKLVNIVI